MGRKNGITIEDVMKMDCMKESKLIAGFKGIRNTVFKVNIMADPDILNWIDEGELLLTTAYSFKKETIELQKKFIEECAEKGLAGIGIKIYPYLEALDEVVIELANKLHFPIIDLYYATPFADIMTPIFKEVFNKQAILLQRLEKIHEKFMNAMLSELSSEDIAQVVYDNLNNPVLIKLEFPYEVIEKFELIDAKTRKKLLNSVEAFYCNTRMEYKEKKLNEDRGMINNKYIKRMVVPIVVKGSIYGHIFTWAIHTPLGGFDLSVLETASTTIALDILKKLSIRDVENRYKTEFFEDLISLDKKRKAKAVERASLFKIRSDGDYVVAVIHNSHHETPLRKGKLSTDERQQDINKVIHSTEIVMNDLGIVGLVVRKTDSINLLLSFEDSGNTEGFITQFTCEMNKLLSDTRKGFNFKMGIGRVYESLENAYQSYNDAIKALRSGDMLDERSVIYFEDLGIYKLLCQETLREELENFYSKTLEPLVTYDQKRSTEFIKTLEAYFKYGGNLKRMSEQLFTHYNTILYRVQRINEITEMNLEDEKDRLSLEMALKIKKVIKR